MLIESAVLIVICSILLYRLHKATEKLNRITESLEEFEEMFGRIVRYIEVYKEEASVATEALRNARLLEKHAPWDNINEQMKFYNEITDDYLDSLERY